MKYLNIFLSIILSFSFSNAALAKTIEKDSLPNLADYVKNKGLSPQKADGGLLYLIEREGTGATPKTGDYVAVAFTGSLLNGRVFDQSTKENPFIFQLDKRQFLRGWQIGLPLFKVGSKGTLLLPTELGYGQKGSGTTIPPNAALRFDIEVLNIMSEQAYDQYILAQEQKERLAFQKRQDDQLLKDKKDIHYYATEKGMNVKTLHSGLSYVIEKNGKGKNATIGDLLTVAYEGYLLDGRKFDQSERKAPLTFELGAKKVITGWEEGLRHFNSGSEGWLLVPSKLAYGPMGIKEGKVNIPANSVLVFKIKVEKIAKKKATNSKKKQ